MVDPAAISIASSTYEDAENECEQLSIEHEIDEMEQAFSYQTALDIVTTPTSEGNEADFQECAPQ